MTDQPATCTHQLIVRTTNNYACTTWWWECENCGKKFVDKEVLEQEEKAHLETIDQRDTFEDFVAATAISLGCKEEWSNLHDHRECIAENIAQPAKQSFIVRVDTPGGQRKTYTFASVEEANAYIIGELAPDKLVSGPTAVVHYDELEAD